MVLQKLRDNAQIIIGVLIIGGLLGGSFVMMFGINIGFSGTGGIPSVGNPLADPAEPNASVAFEKNFDNNNINVQVTFTEATRAEKIVVTTTHSKNMSVEERTIYRLNSHLTVTNLQHNDKVTAYAVYKGQRKEVANYTVKVNRNPHATMTYRQSYDQSSGTYTVTATLSQAPAVDYVTAASPGTFTAGSGDSRDYDGDGKTNDDINIIQKELVITNLEAGEKIVVIGSIDGKTGVVDTYTVTR